MISEKIIVSITISDIFLMHPLESQGVDSDYIYLWDVDVIRTVGVLKLD